MIKTIFAGDVLIQKNHEINYEERIQNVIDECDIKCCNFEAPVITVEDKPIRKIGPNISQNENACKIVEDMKFNLICLANNHICDFGYVAMERTKNNFTNATTIGCGFSLEEIYKPYIYEKDGIRVGVFNIAETQFGCVDSSSTSGYAWAFHKKTMDVVDDLKRKCDFIIVVVHAGLEDVDYPIPEWRDFYRSLIDGGVTAVIGHHPHSVQGYEEYHNGVIFYSLGNFIWQREGYSDTHTILVELNFVNKCEYEYKIHYVDTADYLVKELECNSLKNRLVEINGVLIDESKYNQIVDKMCLDAYNSYYKAFYCSVAGNRPTDTLWNRIISAIKTTIKGNKFDDVFLWHNLAIETHYWTVKRALNYKLIDNEIILEKKKEEEEFVE